MRLTDNMIAALTTGRGSAATLRALVARGLHNRDGSITEAGNGALMDLGCPYRPYQQATASAAFQPSQRKDSTSITRLTAQRKPKVITKSTRGAR